MAENVDEWAAYGRKKHVRRNRLKWVEMQSEGGAAGAVTRIASGRCFNKYLYSLAGFIAHDPHMYKLR
jgi:hypothetical protein